MSPALVGYQHFLGIARRLVWEERAIGLAEDKRAWDGLGRTRRERVTAFVAAFALAEERVAMDLVPFARAAPTESMAACFRAQSRDEERHARFFDRYAREVLGVAGRSRQERIAALRDRVESRFAALFEERLAAVAGRLAEAGVSLGEAVALYHLILEGIVFSAGQSALLADLQGTPALPGLRDGLERVIADERWHIGFGVRVLRDPGAGGSYPVAGGEAAVRAWGGLISRTQRETALRLHRRRLSAAGLVTR